MIQESKFHQSLQMEPKIYMMGTRRILQILKIDEKH
jgi:hypothetical protein